MGRPTGTKTATKGLLVAERRRKAWKLKLEGLTYEEIGRRLGVSNAQTHRDIHHRLDELDEEERQEAKAFRRAIVERDEAMIEALYPQARAGNLEATRGLLAVHRELRQVLGLDEPSYRT